MSEHALRFHVVGEDEVHRALVMALVDACIEELARERGADWLTPAWVRQWGVLEERAEVPSPRRFGNLHSDAPRTHGRIDGQPLQPGAQKLRDVIVQHARHPLPPSLMILMQDTDGDERLRKGMEQVVAWADRNRSVPLVAIGAPHRDAEAWLMLIAERSPDEEARLRKATATLNFDPSTEPERLTAKPNELTTDAKRVLRYVFLGEGERLAVGTPPSRPPDPDQADELAGRLAASLHDRRAHRACGMAAFLTTLRDRLARALDAYLPRAAHRDR